jgi:hypothetical protein
MKSKYLTLFSASLLTMTVSPGVARADSATGALQLRLEAATLNFQAGARLSPKTVGKDFHLVGKVYDHRKVRDDDLASEFVNGESGKTGEGSDGDWSGIGIQLNSAQEICFAKTLDAMDKNLPDLPTNRTLEAVELDFRTFPSRQAYDQYVKPRAEVTRGLVVMSTAYSGEKAPRGAMREAKREDRLTQQYFRKGVASEGDPKAYRLRLSGAYFVDDGTCLAPQAGDVFAALKNPARPAAAENDSKWEPRKKQH